MGLFTTAVLFDPCDMCSCVICKLVECSFVTHEISCDFLNVCLSTILCYENWSILADYYIIQSAYTCMFLIVIMLMMYMYVLLLLQPYQAKENKLGQQGS